MKEVKLLLTDLDDTLLTDEKQITKRTLKAFADLKKSGILTGIATARSEIPAAPYVSALKPEVLILNSGGLVIVNGKTVSKTLLNGKVTAQVLSLVCREDSVMDICAETEDGYYCNQKDIFKFGADYSHAKFHDFIKPFEKEIYKLTIHSKSPENLQAITEQFPECRFFCYAASGWCCIQPEGVCKGKGAEIAAAHLGIPFSRVAAFGDDITDLELLRDAGCGVAMANAIPVIEKAARYHTGSNEEDGVAQFIEDYILIRDEKDGLAG
ncbi:MAG TPA: HAD family hydrolase [Lachnospiraceae bacterium]|nr:HAD family hydrolase [Lachnospiraceae bacterium]